MALLASSAFLFVQVYGEQIKDGLITYLNQHLNTKVEARSIDVSMWEQFPKVSVDFTNVRVQESFPGSRDNLADFNRVYFVLDLWEIIQGHYVIEKILLKGGEINMRIREDYARNFRIFKDSGAQKQQQQEQDLSLDLKNITLKDVDYRYQNVPQEELLKAYLENARFSGQFQRSLFTLNAGAKLLLEEFRIADTRYVNNKPVRLQCRFQVNKAKGIYQLEKGDLRIADAGFDLSGRIEEQEEGPELNLNIQGRKNRLETLLAIVPEAYRQSFDAYSGKGKFYFNATLLGIVSPKKNPRIVVDFGIESGTITKEGVAEKLRQVNLEGHFTNGNQYALVSTQLKLHSIKARLNGRTIEGNMTLNNFTDPYLNLKVNTNVRLDDAKKFIPISRLTRLKGNLFLDAAFSGRISHLQSVETVHKTNFTGDMSLREVNIGTEGQKIDYKNLNGNFRFNGNDLIVKNFTGYAGKSNFRLDGHLRNLASFLFLKNEKLTIDADFRSQNINLKPLLTTEYSQSSKDSVLTFVLPDYLILDLSFQCEEINYEQFHAEQIKGGIRYKGETVLLEGVEFKTMNGRMQLSGRFANSKPGNLRARLNAKGEDIAIRKLFYQMNDFGQQVLTHEHLKGNLNTTIQLEATWDEHLNPLYDELHVNSDVAIEDGELNNFAPIMKLSGLIEVAELKHLSFQKLANNIVIKNREVRIPEMRINSNAFSMDFSGVHNFNNRINYHLRINLSEILFGEKENYETAFGKVVQKDNGQLNLFVKMTGPADDPKIRYDRKAVTDKMKQDLKQEGSDLGDLLRGKDQAESQDKDDYQLKWDE